MNIFKWTNFVFPLEGAYLTEPLITYFLNEFENKLKNSYYLNNIEDEYIDVRQSQNLDLDKQKQDLNEKTLLLKNNILNIEDNMYAFIFKIEFTDNTIRSITDLLFINLKKDKQKGYSLHYLHELLLGYWNLRSDYYHLKEIKNLIITYRLLHKNTHNINNLVR